MPDVLFVGVETGGSLVHDAMPLWQGLLPSRLHVRGVDLDLDTPDERYIELLRELRRDDRATGAVVSAHKVRLFRAARAQFAHLDGVALACEEVNAVRCEASGLRGYARDPISVGRVVDSIWQPGDGDVVCLGAGGTARALAYHLLSSRRGLRFVCADPDEAALRELARMGGRQIVGRVGDGPWDDVIAGARPRSLIVNATGMGKDRPGSPTSKRATFPRGAVVWELNYRGELGFLRHARAQADTAQLQVHDGWRLFCHGWAAALSAVLGMTDDPDLGDRFGEAAESLRPGTS